jgi:hypothetical protein
MNVYAESLEELDNIRLAAGTDLLTEVELSIYRKYTGKFAWLAANTRPDIAFTASDMSRKNNSTTIKDLKRVNIVIRRIKEKPCEVFFGKIGPKEDLMFFGLADASYKMGDKAIGGDLVVLGNRRTDVGVPIYWTSKTLKTVCTSAKAAETRSLARVCDDVEFFAVQIRQLLFDDDMSVKIPIKIFSDSKPLLESIGSIHQVKEKMLRNEIALMKQLLYEGVVSSFSWLNGKEDMMADCLTKEVKDSVDLENLVRANVFRMSRNCDNLVVCINGEIKFLNNQIKRK